MANITRKLTDEIREWLEYNPTTGEFFWKLSGSARVTVGQRAGSVYPNGYRYIQIKELDYRAARLAWFFVTGEDTQIFVDHKNRIRDDDRFENLRLASNSKNQANTRPKINNTSGFKGVSWQPSRGKWIAVITVDGKAKNLGRFDNIVDAVRTYKTAAIDAWGEFAFVPSEDELEQLGADLEIQRKAGLNAS